MNNSKIPIKKYLIKDDNKNHNLMRFNKFFLLCIVFNNDY
jgi:hypothetical protein